MPEINYMQRVGHSRCIRCDFETSDEMSFEQQDAAIMAHLTEKHPNWMIDGGASILKDRLQKSPQDQIEELKDKERKRVKRGDLITDLMIGRSALLRAAEHAKDYWHFQDLHCSLEDKDGYLPMVGSEPEDHIGKYKAAGKEFGWDSLDDELFEINECPLCSARWAAWHARKIMKAKAGLISGILTRMGNHLRERETICAE